MKAHGTIDVSVPFLDKRKLNGLFPPDVSFQLAVASDYSMCLMTEEQKKISGAVEKRKKEFSTCRVLAKQLMVELSGKKSYWKKPLLSGSQREPLWPKSFKGTIAHKRELCAVAVASSSKYKSLGLDVESVSHFKASPGIARHICTPTELEMLNLHREGSEEYRNYLLKIFCAKECLYKALYPLTKEFFGFKDARIILDSKEQSFKGELQKTFSKWREPTELRGRYKKSGDFIFAAMCLSV